MGRATSAVCPIDASHRTVVALEVVAVGILDLLDGGGGDGVLHSVRGDLRRRVVRGGAAVLAAAVVHDRVTPSGLEHLAGVHQLFEDELRVEQRVGVGRAAADVAELLADRGERRFVDDLVLEQDRYEELSLRRAWDASGRGLCVGGSALCWRCVRAPQ